MAVADAIDGGLTYAGPETVGEIRALMVRLYETVPHAELAELDPSGRDPWRGLGLALHAELMRRAA
jgi:hypothetical protein